MIDTERQRTFSCVQNNRLFDLLPTNGTLLHSFTAVLADAVSTEEDHVLQPVHADRTVHLLANLLQLLLQTSQSDRVADVVRRHRCGARRLTFRRRTVRTDRAELVERRGGIDQRSAGETFLHQTGTFYATSGECIRTRSPFDLPSQAIKCPQGLYITDALRSEHILHCSI